MSVSIGPIVKVEGEAEYRASMRNIIASTKELDSELRATAKNFDSFGRATNTNQQKVGILTQKIANQNEAISKASNMLGKVSAKYGENSKEANKYRTNLNNLTADLHRYENELKQAGGDKFGAVLKDTGATLQKVGTNMVSTGKKMTAAFTVPLAAAGALAVKTYAEVDKTMVLANKTMGNTADEADLLSDAMKNAAANSTYSMSDAATAMLNFARAGLDAKQAAATIAPAMNLAAGEGGDLNQVSQGLVATIRTFHGSFDDAATYADVFASACNNSALDIDSLSNSMSIAAPVFSSVGYDVKDAALYLGTMANAGIDANRAANSLKTGLARLISPAKAGKEAMEKLGISVTNADGTMKDSVTVQQELHDAFSGLSESQRIAAASAIFGKQQMSSWLALINTAPSSLEELNTSLENSAGTTQDMADAMMNGFGGSIEKLKSSIDVLASTFGETMAPSIQRVIDAAQDFVDWLNNLDDSTRNMIVTVGEFAAAMGPIIMISGQLTSSMGSIATGISALYGFLGPFGVALTAAAAGVVALGVACADWSTPEESALGRFIDGIGDKLKSAQETLSGATAGLHDALGNLSEYEAYEKVILDLNDVEHKNTAQKALMKDAVDNLKGVIPGLAEAFDEETGSIDKTNQELEDLFEANNKIIVQQAMEDYAKGAAKAYGEAAVAAQMATDASVQAAEDLKNALSGTMDPGVLAQYGDFNHLTSEQASELIDAAAAAGLNMSEIEKLVLAVTDCNAKEEEAIRTRDEAKRAMDATTDAAKEAHEAYADLGGDVNDLIEPTRQMSDETLAFKDSQVALKTGMDDSVASYQRNAEAVNSLSESYAHADENVHQFQMTSEQISEYQQKAAEAAEAAAARQKAVATAEKGALTGVLSSFEDTYNSIAGTAQVNMFEKFAPKNDMTVEEMISNLRSSNEAMKQMQEEQQAVIDRYGDEMGPELVNYLQSMGMDAAAAWHHMFVTMGQDNGEELFQQLAEEFRTGMNLQDEISTQGALNLTAYKMILGEMGSEEIDWSGLRESVEKMDISDDVREELEGAIEEAQKAGIEIPSGLAEGIESGNVDAETAIAELNAAMKGQYDALVEVAGQAGVEIPQNIADGIASGKMSYADAIRQLASYLSGTDVDWSGEAEKAGQATVDSATGAVEGGTGKAQNAGAALGKSTSSGFASFENAFYNTAVIMGNNVQKGLSSKRSAITGAAKSATSGAVEKVQEAARKMKKAMNFTWRLPTLHGQIPRFDVSMSSYGDGNTHVSVPNINVRWSYFANGGILRQPTLIGAIAGENGDEAVLPLKELWSEMDKRYGKGGRTINNTFNITGADNPELTAQIIARRLKMQMRMA